MDREGRCSSPIVATPGYRHTVGIARSWHFLNVYGFILTGVLFVIMLFDTEQWRRLVPQSPLVMLQAWNTWVHYATFHLPPDFNGFYGYNALQQIAYFSVVFVFGPLAILTGTAMSPAVVNRFLVTRSFLVAGNQPVPFTSSRRLVSFHSSSCT